MRVFAVVVGVVFLVAVTSAELVLLQQLSRHGTRSPKGSFHKYCPKDPYIFKYDVWNVQLTGPGELEEVAIGEVTDRLYGSFIGKYNGTSVLVRSADDDRVLQSAEVMMQTLFPPGDGPSGGIKGRPAFVPIHTIPEEEDDLLVASLCDQRSALDYDLWWNTDGAEILQANRDILAPLSLFCGKDALTKDALKNQVDGIGFDRAQGYLKKEELSDEALFAAQNVSIVLQNGMFVSDEAKTYLAGTLPSTLLSNMRAMLSPRKDNIKYYSYFSHRHALYGLANYLGFEFKQHGLPDTMVGTGTSVFIELHRRSGADAADASAYSVALRTFYPHCGREHMRDCGVEAVALPGCAAGTRCTLDEFAALVEGREERTGCYRTLCGHPK